MRGIGVVGGLSPMIVRTIASTAEELGCATFWANDTPNGDGLATLAEAASVTSQIRLGVGVIPVDRQSPEQILRRCADLQLPVHRLTLGIGSGGTRGPAALEITQNASRQLRSALAATIVIGALGPRMIRLSAEEADGVLLTWLSPAHAHRSAVLMRSAAVTAGRPNPTVFAYVRTAVDERARAKLNAEAERYGSIPSYAANFARMGVRPIETCVIASDRADMMAKLSPYDDALDETVARAVVYEDTIEAYLDLLHAVAP